MKAFVIVGHGDFPIALKTTAQMIIGKMENLIAIPLLAEEGKESYKEKVESVMDNLEKQYSEFVVFSDLLGGTPNNCVMELYQKTDYIQIITGVNLPIILTALTADLPQNLLIDEGKKSIISVNNVVPVIKESNKIPKESIPVQSDKPYNLKGVRIDARGIHGQVATAWIPSLQINRVVVIDDNAVKDETQKSALKLAKPNNIKLSILNSKKAIERLADLNSYSGENILIILLDIKTVHFLNDKNFYFDEIILGNVPNREKTEKVSSTVYLSKNEKLILNDALKNGTNVYTQTVPSEKKYIVSELN